MKMYKKWILAVLFLGMLGSHEDALAGEVNDNLTKTDVMEISTEETSEIVIESFDTVEESVEEIIVESSLDINKETENVIEESNNDLVTETDATEEISEEIVDISVTEVATYNVDFSSYENQDVVKFVDRMYDKFLNREPDKVGFDDWYNKLLSGELEGADIIEGFAASKEFESLNLNSSEYLDIMYQGIFDRNPDEAGLATWTPIYKSGVSASYIPAQFVGSDEFTKLCDKFGIARGSIVLTQNRDKDPVITEFVNHFYDKCLDRSGEEGGLNDWTGKLLEQTSTGADISHGFIYSKEFQEKNLDDKAFIETLYQTLLMRISDASGMADWMNHLDNGVSKEYIRAGFVNSKEFDGFCKDYGIKRGEVILTEARDQNYNLTCTVNALYKEANQKKPSGDTLNAILSPMYSGKVSAHEMIQNMYDSKNFKNK